MIGKVLEGRYDILAELGKGGNGVVYLARDIKLGTFWAVKYYKKCLGKEFNVLLKINYPDIPRVVDIIKGNDECFVVMDYINGITLKRKVVYEGMQKEADVIKWGIMLCDILGYLHTNGKCNIIYGDLKPGNILLTLTGRIKLIDFGNASYLKAGMRTFDGFCGTPGFAAPEQYPDGSNLIDERTDIYGFGATISYLLTKKTTKKIREINPLVSYELETIIVKCMEKDPEKRYDSMKSLKVDLQNLSFLLS